MSEGDEGNTSVILGPGPEVWPGSPTKIAVDKPKDPVVPPTRLAPDDKRLKVARLKVISAVQTAALVFGESEIRVMVEEALQNIRNSSDYR